MNNTINERPSHRPGCVCPVCYDLSQRDTISGRASELNYLSATSQTAALDNEAFLLTCEPDELADAADFIALAVAR